LERSIEAGKSADARCRDLYGVLQLIVIESNRLDTRAGGGEAGGALSLLVTLAVVVISGSDRGTRLRVRSRYRLRVRDAYLQATTSNSTRLLP
jgi:hypothetical protein